MCDLDHEIRALGTDWWTNVGQDETFGEMLRIQTNLQTHTLTWPFTVFLSSMNQIA